MGVATGVDEKGYLAGQGPYYAPNENDAADWSADVGQSIGQSCHYWNNTCGIGYNCFDPVEYPLLGRIVHQNTAC